MPQLPVQHVFHHVIATARLRRRWKAAWNDCIGRAYATDLAEHVPGLGSIAFPINPSSGEVIYAVGLTGPYGQIIDQNFEQHRKAIAEAAQRMTKLAEMRANNASAPIGTNAAGNQRQVGPSQHRR